MNLIHPKQVAVKSELPTSALCEQFWLDLRCEGVTWDQRQEVHHALQAAGTISYQLGKQVSLRVFWQADFGPSGIEISPCSQNPGVEIFGPVAFMDTSIESMDALHADLLKRPEVHGKILKTIADRLRGPLAELYSKVDV